MTGAPKEERDQGVEHREGSGGGVLGGISWEGSESKVTTCAMWKAGVGITLYNHLGMQLLLSPPNIWYVLWSTQALWVSALDYMFNVHHD